MFFQIKYSSFLTISQLKVDTLMDAYYVIQSYPLKASELALDQYIRQQYKTSLKNLCIQILANLTFYKNNTEDLFLVFKDPKHDKLAQLITYGTGIIPGSKILKAALSN